MELSLSTAIEQLLGSMESLLNCRITFIALDEPGEMEWPVVGSRVFGTLAVTGPGAQGEQVRSLLPHLCALIASELELREQNVSLESRFRSLDRQNAELAALNRALSDMAYRDPLTRLYQRWYLLEQIRLETTRNSRYGSQSSLLLCDLDTFATLNETYGNAAGDTILRSVAGILQRCCRTSDIVSRFGGDEFCILLTDTPAQGAMEVAERIRKQLAAEPFYFGEAQFSVTASIGVISPTAVTSAEVETALEDLGRAVSQIKRDGGNLAVAVAREISAPK